MDHFLERQRFLRAGDSGRRRHPHAGFHKCSSVVHLVLHSQGLERKLEFAKFTAKYNLAAPGGTKLAGSRYLPNIVSRSVTAKVVDGTFRVQLVPTAGSNPPSYYSVKYNSDGKIQFQETWVVGTSTTPLRIRDVRASSSSGNSLPPPSLSPI